MRHRLGIMQGRLSPAVDGKVQSFPAQHWRDEFALAAECGFDLIEWVLDSESVAFNPLLTSAGRREIGELSAAHGVKVESVCADFFMDQPAFADADGVGEAAAMLEVLIAACADLGVTLIDVPLIKNSSVQEEDSQALFLRRVSKLVPMLDEHGIRLSLESDLPPDALARFMSRLPTRTCGVNYDMGNSAYWGFDTASEFAAYGPAIINVHVKDCTPELYTLPLGQGNVDFDLTFGLLKRAGYLGDFILQAARSVDDVGAARGYLAFVMPFVERLRREP